MGSYSSTLNMGRYWELMGVTVPTTTWDSSTKHMDLLPIELADLRWFRHQTKDLTSRTIKDHENQEVKLTNRGWGRTVCRCCAECWTNKMGFEPFESIWPWTITLNCMIIHIRIDISSSQMGPKRRFGEICWNHQPESCTYESQISVDGAPSFENCYNNGMLDIVSELSDVFGSH